MNRRVTIDAVNVLSTSEIPIPEPPVDGAVVKVVSAGVCHTDVRTFRTLYHPDFIFPRVLGHEISGTVHSIGRQAALERPDLKVGERVAVFPWGKCQRCANCLADVPLCSTMHYGEGPVQSYVYGVWKDGGYQNYITVDLVKFLVKVPDNVSMDAAATLMCSGVTSYNAVTSLEHSIVRALKINGSASVGVLGAGGLALWTIPIIKALYGSTVKVIAVDIRDDKLKDAKAAGADIIHKWGTTETAQEAADSLLNVCDCRLDGIIELTGLADVIRRAHLALNLGGTLTLVGLGGHLMPEMTLDSIIRRSIQIIGVVVGSKRQCEQLLDLVHRGKVRPPPTSHITLSDLAETLDKLERGAQRGRAVIRM